MESYIDSTYLYIGLHSRTTRAKAFYLHALQELCVPVEDVRGRPRLRSVSTRCLQLPRMRTSTGQRSFAFNGPSIWNSLSFLRPLGAYNPWVAFELEERGRKREIIGDVSWCLSDSPKPDSPKLGFRVRVSVSANRD